MRDPFVYLSSSLGSGSWNIYPNKWYSVHLSVYLGIGHTLPKKKGESVTSVTPMQTLFSNSAYSWLQKNITFWKIHKSSSCRKTTFPAPPFKSLYQSSKFCSLKMGCLDDLQSDSGECSVLLSTKHASWEMAHISSPFLPKKGGNIFSHLPGSQR